MIPIEQRLKFLQMNNNKHTKNYVQKKKILFFSFPIFPFFHFPSLSEFSALPPIVMALSVIVIFTKHTHTLYTNVTTTTNHHIRFSSLTLQMFTPTPTLTLTPTPTLRNPTNQQRHWQRRGGMIGRGHGSEGRIRWWHKSEGRIRRRPRFSGFLFVGIISLHRNRRVHYRAIYWFYFNSFLFESILIEVDEQVEEDHIGK